MTRSVAMFAIVLHTRTRFDDVRALSRSRQHAVPTLAELLDELVAFGAAGIRASPT